jgi:outer membrane protein TolC
MRRQFTIRETLFGVARAYYAVLKTQAIVAVNRQTVSLAGDQVEVASHRLSSGDVLRTDLLRAEAVVHAARRTLIESEGMLDLHRNTLANILNLDWNARFTVVEPSEAPSAAASFGQILQNAFVRREDFRASSLGIGQRIERRKEVVASYAPRIVAQANHDWTNVTTNTSDTDGQGIWSALIVVQVPIFTGGQREIDLRKAGHAIERARL